MKLSHSNIRRSLIFSFLLAGILIFVSCTKSNSNSSGQQDLYKPTQYKLRYTIMTVNGALVAVDDESPTNLIEIEPASNNITGATIVERYLVYAKDGKIWKIDLTGVNLSSTQVSSESDASILCIAGARPASEPMYQYRTAGENGICFDKYLDNQSDDISKWVSLDMDSSTLPKPSLNNPFTPISNNIITLARFSDEKLISEIVGYLYLESNNELRLYDANAVLTTSSSYEFSLTGESIILATNVNSIQRFSSSINGGLFFSINDDLYFIDPLSKLLSASLYTFNTADRHVVKTGSNLDNIIYIIDGQKIYSIDKSLEQPAVLKYDHSIVSTQPIEIFFSAQDYLVVRELESVEMGNNFYVIDKRDWTSRFLFYLNRNSSTSSFHYYPVLGNKIVYFDEVLHQTGIVSLDGKTQFTIENARFEGYPLISIDPVSKLLKQIILLSTVVNDTEILMQTFNLETHEIEHSLGLIQSPSLIASSAVSALYLVHISNDNKTRRIHIISAIS